MEIRNECENDKICVEGQLYNRGAKEAAGLQLKIEIGGTKHSRPRKTLTHKVTSTLMNPGDRQDFMLSIDRKITYEENGKPKIIEVGKYNFKIVPTWSKAKPKKTTAAKKKLS
jgi:hypothetical protein